jgi:hypothetical protein
VPENDKLGRFFMSSLEFSPVEKLSDGLVVTDDGLDSLWLSDLPEKHPALFTTANEQAFPVFPCASILLGKPRSPKSVYSAYAGKRWRSGLEAFGLVPTSDIRPVFISREKPKGIEDCLNPFMGFVTQQYFLDVIQRICHSFNVIIIDDFNLLFFRLRDLGPTPLDEKCIKMPASERRAYIGDLLSGICRQFGVYIIVLHSCKSESDCVADSFYGVSRIVETTDEYLDLEFDWRTKIISQRVLFGSGMNELIAEPETALSDRLEETNFEKYGGYEQLRELLFCFKDHNANIRYVSTSMRIPQTTIFRLVSRAKVDGYLSQNSSRSSYSLSQKGKEIIEKTERLSDLLKPSEYEQYAHFQKEKYDKALANIEKKILAGSPSITIGKSVLTEFEAWKAKNSVKFTVEQVEQAEQEEQK